MPIDLAEVKNQLENMSGLPFTVIRPKYGSNKDHPTENKMKLLSWPPTGGVLAKRVFKHFGLGPEGRQQAICPKSLGNANECPICSWVEAASRTDDPALADRIKKLSKSERFMQLCIDWTTFEKEEDPAKKMKLGIYDCPPKVHRNIMQEMASQDYDFTQWESALISLMGYEQGPGLPKGIDFKVTMDHMKPQIVSLKPEDWLHLVPDLETAFTCPSPAQLQFLLDGKEPVAAEKSDPEEDKKEDNAQEEALHAEVQGLEAPKAELPKKEEKKADAPKPKMSLAELVAQAKDAAAKKGKPF